MGVETDVGTAAVAVAPGAGTASVAVGLPTAGVAVGGTDGSGAGRVHVGRGVHVTVGCMETVLTGVAVGRGGMVCPSGTRPGNAQARPAAPAASRVTKTKAQAAPITSPGCRGVWPTGSSPSLRSHFRIVGSQQ